METLPLGQAFPYGAKPASAIADGARYLGDLLRTRSNTMSKEVDLLDADATGAQVLSDAHHGPINCHVLICCHVLI